MHRLEHALGSAAPGQERQWNQRVTDNLQAVANLLEEHVQSADAADGLLTDIKTTRPTLMHRHVLARGELIGTYERRRVGRGETPVETFNSSRAAGASSLARQATERTRNHTVRN